jgi:hypothetical protein
MFKHAYVRGIQTALVNSGAAAFPDEITATKIADYIADRVDADPLVGVSREVTHKIGTSLIQASDWIKQQPGFKAASWNKLATWEDVATLADHNATQLMTKAAEGSTIEGGDKGNSQAESMSAESKMDASQRPPGYAENSLGKSDVDTKPGTVGKEEAVSNGPSESPSGSNSVIEHSRTASLSSLFRKAAEGSTILGGDKGNKEPWSAEGKMDMDNRPAGYAVLPSQGGLGEMMKLVTGPAVIGKEMAQPVMPSQSPGGSNSLTEHSAKAAAEDPYIALFKKVATEVHPYLPTGINENAKIAAVRACMGMNTKEKAHYLHGLHKEASDLPPFMKKDDDDKKDDGKKDDDKKDDKGGLPSFIQDKIDARKGDGDSDDKKDDKDEDKKEASLRDHLRRIATAQRGAV